MSPTCRGELNLAWCVVGLKVFTFVDFFSTAHPIFYNFSYSKFKIFQIFLEKTSSTLSLIFWFSLNTLHSLFDFSFKYIFFSPEEGAILPLNHLFLESVLALFNAPNCNTLPVMIVILCTTNWKLAYKNFCRSVFLHPAIQRIGKHYNWNQGGLPICCIEGHALSMKHPVYKNLMTDFILKGCGWNLIFIRFFFYFQVHFSDSIINSFLLAVFQKNNIQI